MKIALLISETFVAMKSNQKDNPSPLVKKVINYSVYGQNRLLIMVAGFNPHFEV